MHILDIPRDDRFGQVQLHLKRDKPSSYARRRAARSYPVDMQRGRGNADGPTQQQTAFAQWVKDVVDAFADPPRGWSLSRLARESGVHRNNIYGWMNATAFPQPETLQRFCDNLGLDYADPARVLGWSKEEAQPPSKDLPGYLERARALAAHPKTSPERRRVLEAKIAEAEFRQRAAQDMEQTAEDLLREALGDNEDVVGQ